MMDHQHFVAGRGYLRHEQHIVGINEVLILVGQIGVYTGWVKDIAEGAKLSITAMDWIGLILICFVLPALLSWLIALPMRKKGWIGENDLKLDL